MAIPREDIRIASDGLKARLGGPWTERKLYYIERYLRAFMTAMAPKRAQGKWKRLVYLDLLCGPGVCINRESGAEFEGSALRAAKLVPAFDELHFVDLDRENVVSLISRLGRLGVSADCRQGDCNKEVTRIVSSLPGDALALTFLDPEGLDGALPNHRAISPQAE